MRASLLLSFLIGCTCAGAQVVPQTNATDGSVHTYIQGIDIPAIANAPFTAREIVTWDQALIGGGSVSRKYYTLIARDSRGRIHRENRGFVLAASNAQPPLRSITILDPVAGTRTLCRQATMLCATGSYYPRLPLQPDTGSTMTIRSGKSTDENLGSQTMDGLPVTGTREMRTNVAGSNGEDRVIISHTELWYSPDLQIDLSVVRTNPQLGQVTLSVTDLVRGEPDPSLFAVPAGFQASVGAPR
jgi:hypothetical protein